MNRQWNIIYVPYFPPNFQHALAYARSKVLGGTGMSQQINRSTVNIVEEHAASTFKV